jgi:predicted nucleotidyltransferase
MDLHREVAERVGADLAGRDDVLAVLIAGSVCRGEHVATSDIDLLVVTAEDSSLEAGLRRLVDGLLVEWIARSEAEWLARFDRPKTSWLYSFLEAEALMDSGPADRLVKAAGGVLKTYRTSAELRELLATTLWHGQAKLDRAQAAGTPRELGYWAAVCTESVLDGLYAVHDVPLPAGSRRLAYLHLVPLTEDEDTLIDAMLTGSPAGRFEAIMILTARLRTGLGPADHERTNRGHHPRSLAIPGRTTAHPATTTTSRRHWPISAYPRSPAPPTPSPT